MSYLLIAMCAFLSTLMANDQQRNVVIEPFAHSLVSSETDELQDKVTFEMEGYIMMPSYKMFIDGAPALKVSLGWKGTALDVYYSQNGKDIRILSAKWSKTRYEGKVWSEEVLAEKGIDQEKLLKAVALLPSIHYPLKDTTWANLQKQDVQKGLVSLLINPPVEQIADANETAEESSEEAQSPIEFVADETVIEPIIEEGLAAEEEILTTERTTDAENEIPKIEPLELVPEEVLILAAEAEELYAEQVVLTSEPRTLEEEEASVAEFVEALPVELQEALTETSEGTSSYHFED